ncbi:hypothetical protein GTA08_BOTSDO02450 [Neofusicoccum parvum]|uniref:Uncharacterized protein n=1 Tax=Neofusicoccum parvum TaxID=310453 RepID=A0ACB5RXW1_9PEZI|nr:hypothetical protein GTA08_BOTSDO02450 [Neofusicoccum parvum]
MTTLPPCPLPLVDDALRPYIHTRQETLRIRKVLAEHLRAQINRQQQQHQPHQQGAESTTPIAPLTLACAPPELLPEDSLSAFPPPAPPPELTGLRRRYWEAVQAHALAKRRRDALHGELDELRRASHIRAAALPAKPGGCLDTEPHSSFPSSAAAALPDGSSDVQNYIALLHQRRRHAKLQILLDALDRIADAAGDDDAQPNPLQREARQWVKEKLGDAPVPPPEIAGESSSGGGGDAAAIAAAEDAVRNHVLRLKKELLLAKQSLDAETTQRGRAADAGPAAALPVQGSIGKASAVEAQVAALRAARDELIAWIEGELAKMADESLLSVGTAAGATPQRSSEQASSADDDEDDDAPIQDRVEALYARYVSARAALVAAVDAATAAAKDVTPASTLPATAPPDQPQAQPQPQPPTLPPSAVLPFTPALLRAAADERLLAQQTTYLRHRVAAAQQDARASMDRLASESHLVAPGDAEAIGALAWARAASGKAAEADGAVAALLEEGVARVDGARAVLAELEGRRVAFGRVRGEV